MCESWPSAAQHKESIINLCCCLILWSLWNKYLLKGLSFITYINYNPLANKKLVKEILSTFTVWLERSKIIFWHKCHCRKLPYVNTFDKIRNPQHTNLNGGQKVNYRKSNQSDKGAVFHRNRNLTWKVASGYQRQNAQWEAVDTLPSPPQCHQSSLWSLLWVTWRTTETLHCTADEDVIKSRLFFSQLNTVSLYHLNNVSNWCASGANITDKCMDNAYSSVQDNLSHWMV